MTAQPFTALELAGQQSSGSVPDGVAQIVAWANTANAAAALVERLIDTPFIPVSFWPLPQGVTLKDFPNPRVRHPRENGDQLAVRRQGAVAAATGAVLYGGELGFTPMTALTSVYVVRGRPSLYAEAMVALLLSHGGDLVVEELTDSRCRVRARRRSSDDWQDFAFTMERARKAGYVRQNQKYTDDPQSMLYPRCASIACRTVAADVLKGVASVEEIQDEPDHATTAGNGTRTVRARTQPQQVTAAAPAVGKAAPASDDLLDYDRPPAAAVDPEPQQLAETAWRSINARFVELGVTGPGQKEDRLSIISQIVGRKVSAGRDLTVGEGQLVLDNLAGENGARIVRGTVANESAAEQRPDTGDADPDADADATSDETSDGEEDLPDPTLDDRWGKQ